MSQSVQVMSEALVWAWPGAHFLHSVAPEARKTSEPRGQDTQVLAAVLDLR